MFALDKICHITYSVEGLENIPKDHVGIALCKHQSSWETYFLPLLFPKFGYIAKRELLWVPFFGWGLALMGPITIDRKNKSSAMQQIITEGKACLQSGRWVLMFPEGTRVASGPLANTN